MKQKLGSFLLLIGLLSLLLFFMSDFSGNTNFKLFFAGVFSLFLAYVLGRKQANPDEESPRFRMVRKMGRRGPKQK